MVEMISRRLTNAQKEEILDSYRAGENTNALAKKYSCTANTINRTVKNLLSESEYKILKGKRSKINRNNEKLVANGDVKVKNEDLKKSNPLPTVKEENQDEDLNIEIDEEYQKNEIEEIAFLAIEDANDFSDDLSSKNQNSKNNQDFGNNFEEITPLISNFDFDLEKQKLDFEILNYESLPEIVYMIVDKKVELDLKLISDLPEWSFLPENELQRNAILLFNNQRSAKRNCSRNQRVIKIPNTSIFKLSKSYLISKGITRLILEDSIIALDS